MHSTLHGHVVAKRADPLTIPELVAVSGVTGVCFGAFTQGSDASELLVPMEAGNVTAFLVPGSRLERSLDFLAFGVEQDSNFEDPCFPDDFDRMKQVVKMTLYPRDASGSTAFSSIARGLAAMLGGFYEIEGAYFTPEGGTLAVPKRNRRSKPAPPSAVRVAKRALILSALADQRRAWDTHDVETSVRSMVRVQRWIVSTGIGDELTPAEKEFVELLPATLKLRAWLRAEMEFEAVSVFAWALGLTPKPSPTERAAPALAMQLGLFEAAPALLKSATLRPVEEIAVFVAEHEAREVKAMEALARVPPAVSLDPRRAKTPFEEGERRMIAGVWHRAIEWLMGYSTSWADAAERRMMR